MFESFCVRMPPDALQGNAERTNAEKWTGLRRARTRIPEADMLSFPLWSRTTKQAACSSTDHGGGKRRAGLGRVRSPGDHLSR
jgi:hypothetical protein